MSTKKLKSLQDHNGELSAAYAKESAPVPNGLACPQCGKELVDSSPLKTLQSNPPQMNVACVACGWVGYRVA